MFGRAAAFFQAKGEQNFPSYCCGAFVELGQTIKLRISDLEVLDYFSMLL